MMYTTDKMSMMYCHHCGETIDTDYQAEHFIHEGDEDPDCLHLHVEFKKTDYDDGRGDDYFVICKDCGKELADARGTKNHA